MDEKPLQVTLPIDTFDVPTVPSNLYDYSLDDIIELNYIHGAKKKYEDKKFGSIEIQIVPEIQIAITEIQDSYGKTNQSDFYSTIGTYGHSTIQHKYGLDYKNMKNTQSVKFANGKLKELATVHRWKKHLFDKVEGGRDRIAFYADSDEVIAAINQYKKYFRMSNSDIIQACLCNAILQWKPLHEDNKEFFIDTLGEFNKRILNVIDEVKQI